MAGRKRAAPASDVDVRDEDRTPPATSALPSTGATGPVRQRQRSLRATEGESQVGGMEIDVDVETGATSSHGGRATTSGTAAPSDGATASHATTSSAAPALSKADESRREKDAEAASAAKKQFEFLKKQKGQATVYLLQTCRLCRH